MTLSASVVIEALGTGTHRKRAPSVSHTSSLKAGFAGLSDIASFSIVLGVSAIKPTTRSSMTGQISTEALSSNSLCFSIPGGGAFYTGTFEVSIAPMGGSIGEKVWVCLFEHKLADVLDASVPDAIIGPFTKIE
jgi:hypothetical protein